MGHCHRARGCSTETAGEAATGVKSLLMTTKSNCGLFLFYFGFEVCFFFFLNATLFSGIGLIAVIKVARGTLRLPGMGCGEERRAMGADLSPVALRGKILQPYKPSSFSQPPAELLSLPAAASVSPSPNRGLAVTALHVRRRRCSVGFSPPRGAGPETFPSHECQEQSNCHH